MKKKEDVLKEYLYKLVGDWYAESQESGSTSVDETICTNYR